MTHTTRPLRIALASCTDLPPSEQDDAPLHAALRAGGAVVTTPSWDDPTVDWSGFDGCLIRTTWNYMDRREAFLSWAEQVDRCSRLFNPLPVIRWNTLKSYLGELADHGETIAPTVWLPAGGQVDLAAVLAERGWTRAFLKPTIGAAARETLRFSVDEPGLARAQAHLARVLPREGMMLQPYFAGVEKEGEYSVIYIDGEMTHAVRKIPVPGDYRVMDDFGASDEPVAMRPEDLATADRVRRTSEAILGCTAPLLYARVDFLRDDAGQLVVNELELVEPSLFFRHGPAAAERLATALLSRLGEPAS